MSPQSLFGWLNKTGGINRDKVVEYVHVHVVHVGSYRALFPKCSKSKKDITETETNHSHETAKLLIYGRRLFINFNS